VPLQLWLPPFLSNGNFHIVTAIRAVKRGTDPRHISVADQAR
jgi:hypothetical protein